MDNSYAEMPTAESTPVFNFAPYKMMIKNLYSVSSASKSIKKQRKVNFKTMATA